jgi:3D (Asp-Asp-Asp) domain-containing protein
LTTTETTLRLLRTFRLAAIAVCLTLPATALAQDSQGSDPIGDLIAGAAQVIKRVTDMRLRATLYHAGAQGVGSRDSLGCSVVPMRTLAVDPRIIPRRSIVFIEETVGLLMPDGSQHDGLWYASDTGGAIKGSKVDLYTGAGSASMRQFFERKLNVAMLNAVKVGTFSGCPPK